MLKKQTKVALQKRNLTDNSHPRWPTRIHDSFQPSGFFRFRPFKSLLSDDKELPKYYLKRELYFFEVGYTAIGRFSLAGGWSQ